MLQTMTTRLRPDSFAAYDCRRQWWGASHLPRLGFLPPGQTHTNSGSVSHIFSFTLPDLTTISCRSWVVDGVHLVDPPCDPVLGVIRTSAVQLGRSDMNRRSSPPDDRETRRHRGSCLFRDGGGEGRKTGSSVMARLDIPIVFHCNAS